MKAAAYTILTTMLLGLVTNGLALWRDHGILAARVKQVEKTQETQDNTNKEFAKQLYEVHWLLIQSKGINVPAKEK